MAHVARDQTIADRGVAPPAPASGRRAPPAPAETAGHQRRAAAGRVGRPWTALGPMWRDRRMAVGVTVAAAAGYGLLAASLTPRGPTTTSQAVAAVGIGVVVGTVAGLV